MILSVKKLCISGICLILILPFANRFQSKNHQTCLLLLAPNLYCTELNFMYSCVPNILTATRCQQCFVVKVSFHLASSVDFFKMHMCVFVMHTYILHVCLVSLEARRGHQSPWTVATQLWAAVWVLGRELSHGYYALSNLSSPSADAFIFPTLASYISGHS